MSSNETVALLARRVVSNWYDLMSEDFRGVSPTVLQQELIAEGQALGIWEETYALASNIFHGKN